MSDARHLKYLESLDELQEGDILMFRAPRKPGIAGYAIQFMQALIRKAHGHYDTTHTAICTGRDEDGKIQIAHVTGHKLMRYVQEPLEDMIDRDGEGDRPFVVYRCKNDNVAGRISHVAGNVEANKDLRYRSHAAAASVLRISRLNPQRKIPHTKELSESTFCTRFVVQSIKVATKPSHGLLASKNSKYYPHLRSSCTPKTLESYLYHDKNYQMLVYPGKENPYQVIQQEITAQIARISKRTDLVSRKKVATLTRALEASIDELDSAEMNDLQKAIQLVRQLTPILKMNTGFGLVTAESYRSVIKKARSMAIFERDVVVKNRKP